jgi:hypothetical protein
MGKRKGMVFLNGRMVQCIKVSFIKIIYMVMENMLGLMVENM